MKCPICKDIDLVMAEKQGLEIDYCPTCRGVWLDRGELDKILERSNAAAQNTQFQEYPGGQQQGYNQQQGHHGQQQGHHGQQQGHNQQQGYNQNQGYKKKKGSFLSDLFDF